MFYQNQFFIETFKGVKLSILSPEIIFNKTNDLEMLSYVISDQLFLNF